MQFKKKSNFFNSYIKIYIYTLTYIHSYMFKAYNMKQIHQNIRQHKKNLKVGFILANIP